MLHAKFCGNQSAGSGVVIVFKKFSPYMRMAAILVMCQHLVDKFSFPCT